MDNIFELKSDIGDLEISFKWQSNLPKEDKDKVLQMIMQSLELWDKEKKVEEFLTDKP